MLNKTVDHSARTLVVKRALEQDGRAPSFFKGWWAKEGSAYAFLSAYALLFIIFIVVPVLVAFFRMASLNCHWRIIGLPAG